MSSSLSSSSGDDLGNGVSGSSVVAFMTHVTLRSSKTFDRSARAPHKNKYGVISVTSKNDDEDLPSLLEHIHENKQKKVIFAQKN